MPRYSKKKISEIENKIQETIMTSQSQQGIETTLQVSLMDELASNNLPEHEQNEVKDFLKVIEKKATLGDKIKEAVGEKALLVKAFGDFIVEKISEKAKAIRESQILYGTAQNPGYLKKAIKAMSTFFSDVGKWFKKKATQLGKTTAKIFEALSDQCMATADTIRKAAPHVMKAAKEQILADVHGLKADVKQAALNIGKKFVKSGGGMYEKERPDIWEKYQTHKKSAKVSKSIAKKILEGHKVRLQRRKKGRSTNL